MKEATSLRLKSEELSSIIRHVLDCYPQEACGLMAGNAGAVTHVYPVDNALRSPVAFEMEPKQQLIAMLDMEARGLELLAIYHSHPQGPETPSETDIRKAYYPEAAHLIISLRELDNPVIRVYTIVDGYVGEITLLVEQL